MTSRGKMMIELAAKKEKSDNLLPRLQEYPQLIMEKPIVLPDKDFVEIVDIHMDLKRPAKSIILEAQSDSCFDNVSTEVTYADEQNFNELITQPNSVRHPIDCISDDDGIKTSLVPYSEHSDSNDSDEANQPTVKKRRKRCDVDVSSWFLTKNKENREKGKKYFGRKKESNGVWSNRIPKNDKKLKGRCKCKISAKSAFKCLSISDEERKNIFSKFWTMSWKEKKVFIDGIVKLIPVKRVRDRKDPEKSRRSTSILYFLRKNDEEIRVCKTMFLNTLDLNRMTVLSWKKRIDTFEIEQQNSVSKNNGERGRCIEATENLKMFLDSLPKLDSHYCRKSSSKKYLLPEWRSKTDLHNFYKTEWCATKDVPPLSFGTFHKYLDRANISIFQPKKDACEKCAAFKQGHISISDYDLHQMKKKESRNEKNKDKEEENHVFTMDLQAVLLAPKSNVSSLYYKSKMCVHNLCFYNIRTKEGFCYLWNETEGGLNGEEFATIISRFLIEKVLTKIEHTEGVKIILYSDGCTYQNRNAVLSNALLNTSIMHNITIEQKYLEVGHTQMEADTMHACIERQLKNRTLFAPAEYYGICKAASKSSEYDVTYLSHKFFKKFQEIEFFKSIRPGRTKGDPKVTDIRALLYTPDGNIFYKLRFSDTWALLPQRKNKNHTAKPIINLNSLYQTRLKISARKFNDLQDLKIIMPDDYHEFYDNIPHE